MKSRIRINFKQFFNTFMSYENIFKISLKHRNLSILLVKIVLIEDFCCLFAVYMTIYMQLAVWYCL